MSPGILLKQILQALIFPQACVLCEKWVLNRDFSPLCQTCLLSLEEHNQRICYYYGRELPGIILETQGICPTCRARDLSFDFARSYGPYAGNLQKLIWNFKFEGHRRLADPLALLLERSLSKSGLQVHPASIVPVPAHPSRKKRRGFDQTVLLGRALSSRLGIPVFRSLRRVKATRPQPGLNLQERLENVRQALRLSAAERLAQRDVLIVDDVWTTGITATEVCRLLRRETSVERIIVVTLARVSRRHP